MHCNLYVLKPKGYVVDTNIILNDLKALSWGMVKCIGDEITEKNLELVAEIYDIVNVKDKAYDRLEEIKGYIKEHLEYDEITECTLAEACGAYVAIISDNGYEYIIRESELAIRVINNRLPKITDMEIAVFDYQY